jgi:hypothetical protein
MESLEERMEMVVFFKTCFLRVDVGLLNFKLILLALGKLH